MHSVTVSKLKLCESYLLKIYKYIIYKESSIIIFLKVVVKQNWMFLWKYSKWIGQKMFSPLKMYFMQTDKRILIVRET